MPLLSALAVCAAVAAAPVGCSNRDNPAAPPTSAPSPANTERTSDPRAARLLKATTNSPLVDKVMGRAWNGDAMQVSVHSDRSTLHNQMTLCTELASEFGDGYDIKQILVTVTPIDANSSATAPPLPAIRWNTKDRICAQKPA